MDNYFHEKSLLRQEVKRLKAQFTEEVLLKKSVQAWEQVEANPQFQQSTTILLYWSMPNELHTRDFILRWHGKKTIILPVVDGDRLRLSQFEGEQSLRRNAVMNLYEPQGADYPSPEKIELAIIPGIAFDRANHRLGRGKGYYDRLLPHLNTYNIGVCFDFQMLDNIPSGKNDVLMDEVISD